MDNRWTGTHEIIDMVTQTSRVAMLVQYRSEQWVSELYLFEEWYKRIYPPRFVIAGNKLVDSENPHARLYIKQLDVWESVNYWCSRTPNSDCNIQATYGDSVIGYWSGSECDFSMEITNLMQSLPKSKYNKKIKLKPNPHLHLCV